MGWGRKIRDDEKVAALVKSGRPFKPWDDRPRLPAALVWVLEAFGELQTCRPVGAALAPIPWTAVNEWASAKGVVERERFERLVRAMDSTFLEHHYRSLERKEKGSGVRRGSPPRD